MAPLVAVCSNCGVPTPDREVYNDWCPSCVMKWGHPDDAAELVARDHGWTAEAAVAFVAGVSDRRTPTAVNFVLAVQSFGVFDVADDRNVIQIDRATAVAGDGFLYDDYPAGYRHGVGRLPADVWKHLNGAALKLFNAGFPNRAIARVLGMHKITIAEWRANTGTVFFCECGAVATHQGWCRTRFRASRRRQEFMARWFPERRWECAPKDGFTIAWAGGSERLAPPVSPGTKED